MCKCSLKTDYHDCYDIWFESPAVGLPCFSRLATDSWSVNRTDMFLLFEKIGLPKPAYRKATFFQPTDRIVVYTDPFSHCGEGKLLLTQEDAIALGYQDCLASLYIADIPGMSYRYFVIAGKGAWFQHWSTEDWRSNCGDGDLSPIEGEFLNIKEIETACSVK